MPTYWTLENAGLEKTLEAWGIDDLTASFINQAEDVIELALGGRRYDAAYIFAFKSTVIVRRDRVRATDGSFSGGSQYFVGLVTRPHATASGRRESQGCAIVGPWWYLNERGFEQELLEFDSWVDEAGGEANYNTKTSNRIFLNQSPPNPDGTGLDKLTTGQQLTEILTWTLKPFVDAGSPAPFQIGSITLAVDPPIDEVKNITCAEAARKMFRWSPDAVGWFDYTTTPPTFHAKRRAELATFNHDLTAIKPEAINVTPRPDLQRPFVKINFERTNSVNGGSFLEIIEDVYPDPIPAGALNQFAGVPFTIDMRGFTVNSISAALECETIAATQNSWWLNALPEYKHGQEQGRITSFAIDPTTVEFKVAAGETLQSLPRRVIGGQPADWIAKTFQRQTVTCKCAIQTSNGGYVPDRTLSVSILATNATTGTYNNTTSTAGDPLPVGLAQDFYAALSVLPYEGSVRFRRAEAGGLARVGHKLNFIGTAQADWATMNALVQRVSETIFSGATEIEYGTPPHLNLDDLVSLFFVTRNRQITQPINIRSGSALGGGGGTAALSAHTAHFNSSSAPGNPEIAVASKQSVVIKHDATTKQSTWIGGPNYGSAGIILGTAGQAGTTQGRDIRFREWDVCGFNGERLKALFWSSLPYDPNAP